MTLDTAIKKAERESREHGGTTVIIVRHPAGYYATIPETSCRRHEIESLGCEIVTEVRE